MAAVEDLPLLVTSQTVQEFNQLVDEVADGKSRPPGLKQDS